jgi:hypothetical protein
MLKYQRDAWLVFIFLVAVFVYFFQSPGSNGNSRLDLVFSFVRSGQLNIDAYQAQSSTMTIDKSIYHGHYYSDKAIGTALLGSAVYFPFYTLTRFSKYLWTESQIAQILTASAIGVPAAFAGSLIYVLCLYLTGRKLKSFFITLAVAMGTIYFPFSGNFISHPLAAAVLFCAFFLIFQVKTIPNIQTDDWRLFLIGFLLGFALITEYQTALIVLPLVGYFYYALVQQKQTLRRIARSSLFPILGGVIPLVVLMTYNKICFGSPLAIGYSYESDAGFQSAMAQGFMGIHTPDLRVLYYLTIHPFMGLFWQSPVLIFSILGFYFMFQNKQYRGEAVMIILAFLLYLLMNSGYYMWWGGWSSGPRLLIPVLLFLSIPLAFLPRKLNAPAIIAGVISIAQMFIISASTVEAYNYVVSHLASMPFFGYSDIYSFCLQQLIKGNFTSNLGAVIPLSGWASLVPILLVTMGVTGVFVIQGLQSTQPSAQSLDRSQ